MATTVEIFGAKPNKLYNEEEAARLRILRYSEPVPCAHCGKRRRKMLTSIISFAIADMAALNLVPIESPKIYLPLVPVCSRHLIESPIEVRKVMPRPPRILRPAGL